MFFEEEFDKPRFWKKSYASSALQVGIFSDNIGDLCLFEFALRFPNPCDLGVRKDSVSRPLINNRLITRISKKDSK